MNPIPQSPLFPPPHLPLNTPLSAQEMAAKKLAEVPRLTETTTLAVRDALPIAQSLFQHRKGKKLYVIDYRNHPANKVAHYEFECASKAATSRMLNKHLNKDDCTGYHSFYYPTDALQAAELLARLGYQVDYADPEGFEPNIAIGTAFAVQYDGKDDRWTYRGVYNAQCGADEAQLYFNGKWTGYTTLIMRSQFEKMLAQGEALLLENPALPEPSKTDTETAAEMRHSEYCIGRTVKVRVCTQGDKFVLYDDEDAIRTCYDSKEAIRQHFENFYFKWFPTMRFASGVEDLLQADVLRQRIAERKQTLRINLPQSLVPYFDAVKDILPHNYHLNLDALKELLARHCQSVDTALADAYTLNEWSERVLNNGLNPMLRRIFDLKTGLRTTGTTQKQGKAIVQAYIVETFGQAAWDDALRRKAEVEAQREQQKKIGNLKQAYAALYSSDKAFLLKSVADGWRIEQKQQGKLSKLVYTNGEEYIIHSRKNAGFKVFYEFMKLAFELYGNMEQALLNIGALPNKA
ncbi:hypothetical protein [Conchiformibius steedae]|uniref:hypothetical protein n=1 Tax=Conchiformibius steedae TaxID=153493 RepID=UPI0026EA6950|nr:hypothetical protein [Conchiformibius steedae]